MPKVSVLLATFRIGGMDVIRAGLREQTLKDFELIIVDTFYRHRHKEVLEYFSEFDVAHVPPREIKVHGNAGVMFNTGLSLARGDIVFFLGDYTYLQPTTLEEHWKVHEDFQGMGSLVGLRIRFSSPRLKTDLRPEACPITCFQEEFTIEALEHTAVREQKPATFQSRLLGNYYEAPWHDFLLGCNESLPRQLLKDMSGVDEEYDGGTGYQDSDLGFRAVAGGHLLVLPRGSTMTLKIEVRDFLPDKWLMGERYNYGILESKVEAMIPQLREAIKQDGLTFLNGVHGNAIIRAVCGSQAAGGKLAAGELTCTWPWDLPKP